jgi:hypothetical protein
MIVFAKIPRSRATFPLLFFSPTQVGMGQWISFMRITLVVNSSLLCHELKALAVKTLGSLQTPSYWIS